MTNKMAKYLMLSALFVGIVGLSIGFATFSTLLTINQSAKVKPDSKYFKVNFSSSATDLETSPITPTKSDQSIVATNAVIDNTNSPTLKNLSATFTEPGQYVVYSLYGYNTGKYLSYLNEVNFKTINGETVAKKCTALVGARDDYVQAACGDIELTIQVGTQTYTTTNNNITGHTLARNSAEPITIKIAYVNRDHWVDGDFEIQFGDITLDYSSID